MKTVLVLALALPLAAAVPCRELSGDRIRVRDLTPSISAFAMLDPSREVGPAPLPGLTRVFRTPEIERLARSFGVSLTEKPQDFCLQRTVLHLTSELLQPVLTEAYGSTDVQIKILDYSRYAIPQGSLEFLKSALSASGLWRGRVMYGENRSSAIWARVRITDGTTGEPLRLAPAKSAPLAGLPKDVERGDAVRVRVTAGNVLLSFDGSAETPGRTGDLIIVKSYDGRRLQARVEGKGKVVIEK